MILNGDKAFEIIVEKFESETKKQAYYNEGLSSDFKRWLKKKKLIHPTNGKFIAEVT